ncbi:uncharacterized protein DUF3199 [Fusobacterium naviforme]|nr:DUF3199 family protein [Fusobacterium naviforme]PSL10198.1 uncharacterized protein DUF3199 [Fusobacterium naviforme]STO27608.1 Protein of uncharacterised function (DUF3199) [Fusobacterium naviforme]
MATRPWVTPQEVRDYSENAAVQARTDARLNVDIARAEQYVITYTHNDFKDDEEVPSAVKTAVIILAENYGRNAAIAAKDVKSETFDDYSYTAADSVISIDGLDLAALLDDFVKAEARRGVTMRMRRL